MSILHKISVTCMDVEHIVGGYIHTQCRAPVNLSRKGVECETFERKCVRSRLKLDKFVCEMFKDVAIEYED